MATKITGTNTAAAPGVTGDDTDTGLFYGTNEIGFSTGGTSRLTLDSSGYLNVPDNGKIRLGTGNDLEFYHNGSHNYLVGVTSGQNTYIGSNGGQIQLQPVFGTDHGIIVKPNDAVEIYWDGSKKFETSSTGVSVTGQVVATTNFKGADSVDLVLGTGSDFRILHDGTDNVLTSDGGQSIRLVNHLTGGNETMGKFIPNGAVELYHNGVEMFYTSASGCHVGRPSAAAHLHFLDGGIARFGAGNDLEIYHDGSHSRIVDSGTGNLMLQSDRLVITDAGNSENQLVCQSDGAVELYHNGSKKFETLANGATVHGHLYQEDNEAHYLGSANDLTLWHDGTDSRIRYNHTVGSLKFQKNDNSDAMVIDLAGRVGIGRTPKSYHSNNKGIIEGDSGWVVHGRSNNWLGIGQNHYYDSADLGKYRTAGEASMYIQQDGKHTFYVAASGSEDATCSLQSVLVAKNDRNVEITDGNLIVASGHGIDFSATADNGVTTPNELLSDYEEGTWTPTINSGGYGIGTVYKASYRRIGTAVFIQMYIVLNGSASSNNLVIGGLPFTNAANGYTTGIVDFDKGGKKGAYVRTVSSGTTLTFYYSSENTSVARVQIIGTDIGSGYIIFSFHYFLT